jgi:hypothetical protein
MDSDLKVLRNPSAETVLGRSVELHHACELKIKRAPKSGSQGEPKR